MFPDEKWQAHYDEVVEFIEAHHRNPSHYNPQERGRYVNWIKHNKMQMNAGEMKGGECRGRGVPETS